MIPRTVARWQTSDWQSALKNMIRSLDDLCAALDISPADLDDCYRAEQAFAVKVPLSYLQRIERGNPRDPLLLQVLPQAAEMVAEPGFCFDPLQEADFNPIPGLMHKYHGRVLLITTPSCSIHCRYCFRRHFPYNANTPGLKHWHAAMDYIRADRSIHEAILSGGDPLSATDEYLQQLIEAIAAIPHVQTLRLHSRIPVVMPERITGTLLQLLSRTRLKVVMVLHVNHANELAGDAVTAIKLLQQQGIRLYNQAVLLRGVNATLADQRALLEALFQLDIQAYYLHLLDKVQGSHQFLVEKHEAVALYQQLQASLPGYMLPRLVEEIPDKPSKTPVVIASDKAARFC